MFFGNYILKFGRREDKGRSGSEEGKERGAEGSGADPYWTSLVFNGKSLMYSCTFIFTSPFFVTVGLSRTITRQRP